MPNHCSQQVSISGPRFLVTELHHHLTKADPEFCQIIAPMPFEQWQAPNTRSQRGHEIAGWYSWRLDNWGTKWDVVDVEITQPLKTHDETTDVAPHKFDASFSFNCWTAWTPPIAVWDRLVAMGIKVSADYQDEGMIFEGTYLNGEDTSWEPEIEEEMGG